MYNIKVEVYVNFGNFARSFYHPAFLVPFRLKWYFDGISLFSGTALK